MYQIVKTKFEIGGQRKIPKVLVKINEIELKLHIDIGSENVIINRSFAEKELNLKYSERTKNADGIGNNTVKMNFSRANILIAGKKFDNFEIAVMDMSLLGDTDGVIGYQLLKDFRVVLDYKNLEFSLETSKEDSDMQQFEFMVKHIIKIPAIVGGEHLNFVLDSGAEVNCFSKSTMDKLNWKYQEAPDPSYQAEGIRGKVKTWGTIIPSVNVWDIKIDTSESPTPVIELPEQYESGILGYQILKDNILTIDYPTKQISLKKQ